MKRLLYLLFFCLNILMVANIFSGETVIGNGGDVLTGVTSCIGCDDTGVTLLDYYEAETIYSNFGGLDIPLPDKLPITEEEYNPLQVDNEHTDYVLKIVQNILNRLSRVSPERAKTYWEKVQTFIYQAAFLDNVVLVDIDDSFEVVIPKGGVIEQIAIKRNVAFPYAARHIIKYDYWMKLTYRGRAGLILHEIIYDEALKNGHQNSIATRYFNAMISSQIMENISPEEFVRITHLINFEVEFQGLTLNSVTLHENGEVYEGIVEKTTVLNILKNELIPRVGGKIQYYPNGKIMSTDLAHDSTGDLYNGFYRIDKISLYDTGKLKGFILSKNEKLNWNNNSLPTSGDVEFDQKGNLKRFKLAKKSKLNLKVYGQSLQVNSLQNMFLNIERDEIIFRIHFPIGFLSCAISKDGKHGSVFSKECNKYIIYSHEETSSSAQF